MARIVARTTLLALALCSRVAGAIQMLPSPVTLGLAAWILVSVQLGVAVGHCVLNED